MLVLNGVVGAGVFALPGVLLADFGAFSPYLIPLFGVLALFVALPVAETARFYDRSGGPVAAVGEAFGPFAGFQAGWTYFIARLSAFAANATVFAAYAGALYAPLGEGVPRGALITLLIAGATFVNVIGVRRAVAALDTVSVLKIAPLVLIPLIALATAGRGAGAVALPAFSEIETASLLVFYAFIGFENAVVPAGETRNPAKVIPRAVLATLAATACLYFLVQFAYAALMAGEAPGGAAPLVAFGEKALGPAGALIMIAAALFSIAGNLLGSMVGTPRVPFALAQAGALPDWFGRLSARYATPANAILFMGAAALLLALSGGFVLLAVASTLARLFVYLSMILSLPRIRAARGEAQRPALRRSFFILLWWAGAATCVWAIAQSPGRAWLLFGALVAVGGALFAVARRFAGKP